MTGLRICIDRIQKGQNPTAKQCPEHDPCRQHLPGGAQITQHDPLTRPHPRPTEGSLSLILAPFCCSRGLSKASPKFLIWPLINFY